MMETDKEYKLRCLCSDIIEYFEKSTNDFDDLCNCQIHDLKEEGKHTNDCITMQIRIDMENFQKKISIMPKDVTK